MPDPEGGLKPRTRRRTWLLWTGVALAGLVVLAILAGPQRRLDDWARGRLRREISSVFGRPASVANVHLSVLSFELVARDIVIGEAPPATGRVLEIPVVSASVSPFALIFGRVELTNVRVERPRVRFSRAPHGLEGPIPIARAGEGGGTVEPKAAAGVVLRRLEVVDGIVSFEDRTVPFWCTAEGLSIAWNGDEFGNGEGSLQSEQLRGGTTGEALEGRANVRARLDAGALTMSAEVGLGHGSVTVSGSTRFGGARAGEPPSGELHVAFVLDGSERGLVPRPFLALDDPITGSVRGSGTVRFTGSKWTAEGSIRGDRLRYQDVASESLDVELRASAEVIEVVSARAEWLGGNVTGSARLEPRTGGLVRVDVQGDGIPLNEALRIIGLDSPLEGRSSCEGTLDARLGEPDSVDARLEIRVVSSMAPIAPGLFGTEGTGTLLISGRALTLDAEEVRAGASSSPVRIEKVLGTPTLSLGLDVETSSISDSSALLEAFLTRQSEPTRLPWDSSRLAGRGRMSGEFVFEKDHPVTGDARFDFEEFAYESIGAARVSGTGRADGSTISIAGVRAEKEGGVALIEGSWPEGGPGASRVRGHFERWPVNDLLTRLGAPDDATTRISGDAEYRDGPDGPRGDASFTLGDASVAGVTFTQGRFVARLSGSRFEASRISLKGPDATIEGHGSYDMDTGRTECALEGSHLNVALAAPRLGGLPLEGHVAASLHLVTGAHRSAWSLKIRPEPDLTFSGASVEDLALAIEGDGSLARAEGSLGSFADLSATVSLAAPHEGEGKVVLHGVPVGPLLAFAGSDLAEHLSGEVAGEIDWSGPLDDTAGLHANATLDPVRIAAGTESFQTVRPAVLSLSGGRVLLEDVELRGESGHVSAKGTVPLDGNGTFDLDLRAEADVGALAGFISGLSSSGSLKVSLRAEGTAADLVLAGRAEIDQGRMRVIGFPLIADRIRARARIERGAIVSDDITAVLGGGECRATGRVDLEGLKPTGFRLEARVITASLAIPEGFRGLYSGNLTFAGKTGERPSLRGRLDLIRGTWQNDFGLDRVSLGGRVRPPVVEVRPPDEGLAATELDVTVHADDNVWCHNDLADVEGSADLEITGTVGRPALAGRFDAFEGGEMRFRRVRYQIEQATVIFPPGQRLNAEFSVVADTRVRDYDIRMHLSGNFDRLDYELTSNPPLPQQEILSLLLTGSASPVEALAGAATGQFTDAAANVVGGEIGGLVGERLGRWLGFEEIRLDPLLLQGTADPTARVTLGKRLSQKLFVKTQVALNSPEAPIYQVEYQLNRKLRLLFERGELGSLGGDIRYGTRFRSLLEKPQAAPLPASSKANKAVASVIFRGDTGEPPETLGRVVSIRKGDSFSRQRLLEAIERLKKRYVRKSYLGAFIQASTREGDPGTEIEFTIERGPKISLEIAGAGIYERRIRESLQALWLDTAFSGDVVGEAEERILKLLRDEGFYAAYLTTKSADEDGIKKVTVTVDMGEKVRVESVEIAGAESIPESEVRRQILTGEDSLFQREVLEPEVLQADVAAIENLYRSRGFLQASARSDISLSPDGRRAKVRIQVDEGPASRLRRVTISGNERIDAARILERVKSRAADPFRPAVVLADTEAIRSLYDEQGYPDVTVVESVVTDGEWVDLVYEIREGDRKLVRRIEIEGNTLTKDSVIRREIQLADGDPISQQKIREIQQRLMRTGLFHDVQISYEPAPNRANGHVLHVKVRDADNLILGLGAGYDTENGPRGSVEIADTNLWGYGRYAGLSVLYGSKLQRVQATFKDPRLFQRVWTSVLSSFYEKRERETFTQRGVGSSLLLERKTSNPVRHYLRYTIGVSEVFDLSEDPRTFREAEPKLDLGRLRLASAGYAIVRDTRNDPLNSSSGTYSSADYRVFAEALGSEKRFSKLFLQGTSYTALPLGLIWGSSMRVGLASEMGTGEPLPLQERYFAGGDSSVRGFGRDLLGSCEAGTLVPVRSDADVTDCAENRAGRDIDGDGTRDGRITKLLPIGGQALVVLNNELRRPIFKSFSAVAFWDSGDTFLRPSDIRLGTFRNTLGLGLRLDTPVGPLRLEYGRKIDREPTESRGEFVFSFGQTF